MCLNIFTFYTLEMPKKPVCLNSCLSFCPSVSLADVYLFTYHLKIWASITMKLLCLFYTSVKEIEATWKFHMFGKKFQPFYNLLLCSYGRVFLVFQGKTGGPITIKNGFSLLYKRFSFICDYGSTDFEVSFFSSALYIYENTIGY